MPRASDSMESRVVRAFMRMVGVAEGDTPPARHPFECEDLFFLFEHAYWPRAHVTRTSHHVARTPQLTWRATFRKERGRRGRGKPMVRHTRHPSSAAKKMGEKFVLEQASSNKF